MTSARSGFGDDDYDDVFATTNRLEAAGEQARVGKAPAPANLIWVGQRISDTRAMFGKQVGVPFGDVSLPFIG